MMTADDETDDTLEQQVDRMAQKLHGQAKFSLVREYLRYQMAKQGKLAHNMPAEYIDVTMKALRKVLRDRYQVNDRTLLRMLKMARKKTRPRPFV